jgi:hypothetical protein
MDQHRFQGRGPTSSAVKNEQMRQFSAEFRALFNRVTAIDDTLSEVTTLVSLDSQSAAGLMEDMRARIAAVEQFSVGDLFVPLSAATVIVDGNQHPVLPNGGAINFPLALDTKSGVATLNGAYTSKIRTSVEVNGETAVIVHPEVECRFDYEGTLLASNDVKKAVDGNHATAFLVEAADITDPSFFTFYVRVPTRGYASELTNVIDLTLAPLFYCNLIGLQYTTDAYPQLNAADTWQSIQVTVDEANSHYYPPQLNGADPEESLYMQKDFGSRRYCLNEERITALRFVVAPRTDGSGLPVSMTVANVEQLMFGIRDLDAGLVKYVGTGTMSWELTLPEPVSHIDSVRARLVNTRYVGVYDPEVTVYVEQSAGVWSAVDLGEFGADITATTKIRVSVTLDAVNKTVSPVLAGFDIAYGSAG